MSKGLLRDNNPCWKCGVSNQSQPSLPEPWESKMSECKLCKDTGVILVKAKRQIGYTLGFDENPNVLEEHWESCPVCSPKP